jgi:hypothetical protein
MALEATAVFLHRPYGVLALPIGSSVAHPEQAIRAVLKTAEGSVLVRSIARQADRSFIGEVYGVTPGRRGIALGDLVSFSESQIFTFKTTDQEPVNADEAEITDMVRAFDESFSNADAHIVSPAAAAGPTVADFSFEPAADTSGDQPPKEPVPAVAAESHRFAPAVPQAPAATPAPAAPPTPAPIEQELSTAEAYSILGAPERGGGELQRDRVEPVLVDPATPAEVSTGGEQPIGCLECGAPLTLLPSDGTTQTPPKSKVSCANCGRINDIAQAQAASRRRRSVTHDASARDDI